MAGQTYYELGSTDLGAPVDAWTRLGTNSFGPGGWFGFADVIEPSLSQQFYLIEVAPGSGLKACASNSP